MAAIAVRIDLRLSSGSVTTDVLPHKLRLLARANAPILTTSTVTVQHHPADASAWVAKQRVTNGRLMNDLSQAHLGNSVLPN